MSLHLLLLGNILVGLLVSGCGTQKAQAALLSGQVGQAKGTSATAQGPFRTTGREFSMSVACSHHSTQITLQVGPDALWLRYTTTRWDTLVLHYATHTITREVQSSDRPTLSSDSIDPPESGGDPFEYRNQLSEFLTSTTRLIDGNGCTPPHPELVEVRDYVQKLMPPLSNILAGVY